MAAKLPFRHIIPIGTRVSFRGDSLIYVVDCYSSLLSCDGDCGLDHDCFHKPSIKVRKETWMAFPLEDLLHVFDQPDHRGRDATVAEKTAWPN